MTSFVTRARDEDGMALLIAVILLLMISAIGLTALQSAQDESSGSGRSRRKVATLAAATSAMELVAQQLGSNQQYPNTAPISIPGFMTDQWGGATDVRTGSSDTATPQDIRRVGHEAGGQINVGGKNTTSYGVFRADVTATDATGGVVELQAQYSISEGSQGYQ